MNLTQQQIDKLMEDELPTIEIEKETVECPNCKKRGWVTTHCYGCNGKGKTPKYEVGEEINLCGCGISISNSFYQCSCEEKDFIKLKIISETEYKQKIQMVS